MDHGRARRESAEAENPVFDVLGHVEALAAYIKSCPTRVSPDSQNSGCFERDLENTTENTTCAKLVAGCMREHLTDEQLSELTLHLLEPHR